MIFLLKRPFAVELAAPRRPASTPRRRPCTTNSTTPATRSGRPAPPSSSPTSAQAHPQVHKQSTVACDVWAFFDRSLVVKGPASQRRPAADRARQRHPGAFRPFRPPFFILFWSFLISCLVSIFGGDTAAGRPRGEWPAGLVGPLAARAPSCGGRRGGVLGAAPR